MVFQGANPNTRIEPAGIKTAPAHYFLGRRKVHVAPGTEGAVRELYTGISSRLFFDHKHLRYDFLVSPGVDPAQIQIEYKGVLPVKKGGDVWMQTPLGTVRQTRPKAYQLIGTDTVWVPVEYHIQESRVSFLLGNYDHTRSLTIDPTLIFSTYSGSNADNWGFTATYDRQGSMFSGGIAFQRGFPTTIGAVDTSYNGSTDMAILKFNADGTRLEWATYLGGTKGDIPTSMIADGQDRLYILGVTGSNDFPTALLPGAGRVFGGGPSQTGGGDFRDGTDISVSLLSSKGDSLLGFTYLGGTGTDGFAPSPLRKNYGDIYRGEINLDASGNVCIATNSQSTDFTQSLHTIGQLRADGQAFLLRLSPRLDTLINRITLGGGGEDAALGLTLDSAGNVYACGGTTSSDFPTTPNVYQSTYKGGIDGFLVKIAPDWTRVEAATYVGTPQYDQAYLVQTDTRGRPTLVGQTAGNYPFTAGVWHQGSQGGQFIHGFTPDLQSTTYATVYGGPRPILSITAFLIDKCNSIYVSGWGGGYNQSFTANASVVNFPVTRDAYQAQTDGSDFHFLILTEEARTLQYATFFGGRSLEHVDGGTSRFDKRGIVYQAVCSSGPSPTTAGSYSPVRGRGFFNNLAFKFALAPTLARLQVSKVQGCAPFTVQFHNRSIGADQCVWTFDTLGSSISTDSIVPFTFTRPGIYTVTLFAISTQSCFAFDSTRITIEVTGFGRQVALQDTAIQVCSLANPIQLNTPLPRGNYTIRWTPGRYLSDSTVANPVATPGSLINYTTTVTDSLGCRTSRTVRVKQKTPFTASSTLRNDTACTRLSKSYRVSPSIPGSQILWYLDNTLIAQNNNSVYPNITTPGRHTLRYLIQNDTACPTAISDSAFLVVIPGVPSQLRDSVLFACRGETLTLAAPIHIPYLQYKWYLNNSSSWSYLSGDSVLTAPYGTNVNYYIVEYFRGNCRGTARYRIKEDTLQPTYSILSEYSPCTNRYTLQLRGTNPRAETYTFTRQDSGTFFSVASGISAIWRVTGNNAGFQYSVSAQRSTCVVSWDSRENIPNYPVVAKAGFDVVGEYPACDGPARIRMLPTPKADGDFRYRIDGREQADDFAQLQDTLPHIVTQIALKGPCRDSLTKQVQYAAMHMPNILTPNQDGLNDNLSLPQVINYPWHFYVYDRWGHAVGKWEEYASGTFPPSDLQTGVYFYKLWQTADDRPCSGWIEVVRH